jgi:mannose-6-phosphate isomerase
MNRKIIKPWGYEILLEKNSKYMFKKLFMKKGHQCSLQYHKKKRETIYVLSGKLKIFLGKKSNLKQKLFKKGDVITINPGTVHRMFGVTNSTYLEASTPELSDVVRLTDDYNRN